VRPGRRRWVAPSNDSGDYDFGRTVASVGDLDGDCRREVAIGAVNVHASHLPDRVEIHSVGREELLLVLTQAGLEAAWAEQHGASSTGEGR
jgi:hypothetical protein